MQNVDQLHAHDSHQNVTEPQATETHLQHENYESGLAITYSMLHTGWFCIRCGSCGDSMERWNHLVGMCYR